MTWHTVGTGDSYFVQDGDRIVGSIARVGEGWHVEILWSAPGGDITFDAERFVNALAFVEGVEKTIDAFKRLSL